jgi:hypothetical protein
MMLQIDDFEIGRVAYAVRGRRRSHDAVIHVYDDAGQGDRNTRTQGRFQGAVNRWLVTSRKSPMILQIFRTGPQIQ